MTTRYSNKKEIKEDYGSKDVHIIS